VKKFCKIQKDKSFFYIEIIQKIHKQKLPIEKQEKWHKQLIKKIEKHSNFIKHKNTLNNLLTIIANESKTSTSYDVFWNAKYVKRIYQFYPNIFAMSKTINKMSFEDIIFFVVGENDCLHFEFLKFCELHNPDFLLCFFPTKPTPNLISYLSHSLGVEVVGVFKNKIFCCNIVKNNINLRQHNPKFCDNKLFSWIYHKLK